MLKQAAKRAGIPAEAICRHLQEYVGDDERKWCRGVMASRSQPHPGILYVGKWPDVNTRMDGIAGAMVRNFIDARVMPINLALEERPASTVLLVPNFCTTTKQAGWQAEKMSDLILERLHANQVSVLYGTTMDDIQNVYGTSLRDVFLNRFKVLKQ
jgi:hypothetical protein